MTAACLAPVADETMVDYWSGGLLPQQSEAIEEHVFGCASCAARLDAVSSMAAGITSLARQGRVSGVISRATLNQLQRDGVRVRVYSLMPGDVVPCAVFPDDDLIVTSLRGNFAGVDAVTLSVTGSTPLSGVVLDDIPVSAAEGELLWATPGVLIRQMPTSRLTLTVTAGRANERIGEVRARSHRAVTAPYTARFLPSGHPNSRYRHAATINPKRSGISPSNR